MKPTTLARPDLSMAIVALVGAAFTGVASAACRPDIVATNPDSAYTVDDTKGLVTDTRTGLVWKRCAEGYDHNNNGTIGDLTDDSCDVNGTDLFNWHGAITVANSSTYASSDDWRLPNVKELFSLFEQSCTPSINENIFPDTPVGQAYWSSTLAASGNNAWMVLFNSTVTAIGNVARTQTRHIRLVRAGAGFAPFTPDDAKIFSGYTRPDPSDPTATTGAGTAEIVSGAGCKFNLTPAKTRFVAPSSTPANVYFPHGLFEFELTGCTDPAATVKITWPSAVAGGSYYKFKGGTWSTMPATTTPNGQAVTSGNVSSVAIADNGAYDTSATTGVIADPGGLGLLRALGSVTIPTMPQALAGLMAMLLAGIGFARIRRKGTH